MNPASAAHQVVSDDHVENAITSSQFYVFPGTALTICCLTLRNGHRVLGHAHCEDPPNFRLAHGRALAREDAKQHVVELERYRIRDVTAGWSGVAAPTNYSLSDVSHTLSPPDREFDRVDITIVKR